MNLIDQGEGKKFRYLITSRGKDIAQFVRYNEAWAYRMQLEKALRKIRG